MLYRIVLIIVLINNTFGQTTSFLKFELMGTHMAISGITPWFDSEVTSKDACFRTCLQQFTECEFVQYKEITSTRFACLLYDIISEVSQYLFSEEGQLLARAVHEDMECQTWRDRDITESGVYFVFHNRMRLHVYCEMLGNGEGWTTILKRKDGSEDFSGNWEAYKKGFGNPNTEFYIRNEALHQMTSGRQVLLKLEGTSFSGVTKSAIFKGFYIDNETNKYRLHTGEFVSGDTDIKKNWGNHDNCFFTTRDSDNDISGRNCAIGNAPWWHKKCIQITFFGRYPYNGESVPVNEGILIKNWLGMERSLKEASMAIRKIE